ncbi:hypothetical protein F2Q70_00042452 [Brassica cretica]|uniref:Uncharacterized protein n=1 Tax=Brassica cretica TaxID=69181 RepID=A0A8S9KNH6_BRACR|nr:hypothetical protein F2Q70_00042452 [Brassica cretica]KAF2607010.1 hypothetical protein F2Q68_00043229 [Brassica cretica]
MQPRDSSNRASIGIRWVVSIGNKLAVSIDVGWAVSIDASHWQCLIQYLQEVL